MSVPFGDFIRRRQTGVNNPMKNVCAIVLFVLLSVLAVVAQTPPEAKANLTELPENVLNTELQMLGGKTLKLSEYSGNAFVINLFATWCGPCRLESPELAKIYNEYKKRGLVVIELSVEEPKDSSEVIREWVWDYRLPYPVGWASREVALTLMQGRGAIPQAFVVARDGRIVRRFIGYNPQKSPSQIREAVEEALK